MSDDREPTDFGWYLLTEMARRDPPLTQTELARNLGISQSTISRWIYGTGRPDTDRLALLAQYLGADPGEVLYRAGYGAAPKTVDTLQPEPESITRLRLIILNPALPDDKRHALDAVLTAVAAPYLDYLPNRRQRRAG